MQRDPLLRITLQNYYIMLSQDERRENYFNFYTLKALNLGISLVMPA